MDGAQNGNPTPPNDPKAQALERLSILSKKMGLAPEEMIELLGMLGGMVENKVVQTIDALRNGAPVNKSTPIVGAGDSAPGGTANLPVPPQAQQQEPLPTAQAGFGMWGPVLMAFAQAFAPALAQSLAQKMAVGMGGASPGAGALAGLTQLKDVITQVEGFKAAIVDAEYKRIEFAQRMFANQLVAGGRAGIDQQNIIKATADGNNTEPKASSPVTPG